MARGANAFVSGAVIVCPEPGAAVVREPVAAAGCANAGVAASSPVNPNITDVIFIAGLLHHKHAAGTVKSAIPDWNMTLRRLKKVARQPLIFVLMCRARIQYNSVRPTSAARLVLDELWSVGNNSQKLTSRQNSNHPQKTDIGSKKRRNIHFQVFETNPTHPAA